MQALDAMLPQVYVDQFLRTEVRTKIEFSITYCNKLQQWFILFVILFFFIFF